MTDETIVAVFDTEAHATAAVRDLEEAGVSPGAIDQHRKTDVATLNAATGSSRGQGFWGNLFGGEPEREHDTAFYNRSLEEGSTVVTVRVAEERVAHVTEVLERHNPVDIDERAATYGISQSAATPGTTGTTVGYGTGDETLRLAEETLAVGKRAINRGTTRIRRYVVETPVEEQVTLRNETVSIERRPVSDNRSITDADFTDKVVEVTETDEEAVVSKTARVKEEVVIRKDATERTETVRDTVRHEDVEITKDGGVEHTAAFPAGATTRAAADPRKSTA